MVKGREKVGAVATSTALAVTEHAGGSSGVFAIWVVVAAIVSVAVGYLYKPCSLEENSTTKKLGNSFPTLSERESEAYVKLSDEATTELTRHTSEQYGKVVNEKSKAHSQVLVDTSRKSNRARSQRSMARVESFTKKARERSRAGTSEAVNQIVTNSDKKQTTRQKNYLTANIYTENAGSKDPVIQNIPTEFLSRRQMSDPIQIPLDCSAFSETDVDEEDQIIRRLRTLETSEFTVNDKNGHSILTKAADRGQCKVIEYLHQRGVDLNTVDGTGYTPLAIVSALGHTDVMKFLDKQGIDLSASNSYGRSPLTQAAANNQMGVLRFLDKKNCIDLSQPDAGGLTATAAASLYGNLEILQFLERTDWPELVLPKINEGDPLHGLTPITMAAANGHNHILNFLIGKGVDFKVSDLKGFTPLTIAAARNRVDTVQYLCENHYIIPDIIMRPDNRGRNVATVAAKNDSLEVIQYLHLRGDIDLETPDQRGYTCATAAACKNRVDVIKFLHETCTLDMTKSDENWFSPLTAACSDGKLDVINYLAECEICLKTCSQNGCSPLTTAAGSGHINVLEHLQSRSGISLKDTDGEGYTPLTMACATNEIEMIKYLEAQPGISLTDCDANGSTPFTVAAMYGNIEVLEYLNSRGVKLTESDKSGFTALTAAAASGEVAVIKYLKKIGIDPSATDRHDRTALSYAQNKKDNKETVLYLKRCISAPEPSPDDHTNNLHTQAVNEEVVDIVRSSSNPKPRPVDPETRAIRACSTPNKRKDAKLQFDLLGAGSQYEYI